MGYTIGTRWNSDTIKDLLNKLGYISLDNVEDIRSIDKINFKDNEGYFYYASVNFLKKYKPSKFDTSNPHTIQNIILWIKINKLTFKLLSEEYQGATKNLEWQCLKDECGEIFEVTWNNIQKRKSCPFCSGKKVGLSNCLATINPQLSSEWHTTKNGDLTPWNVTANSGKYVWWQCKDNPKHEWYAQIKSRNEGRGCHFCCHNPTPSEDYNLLVCNPELAKEWDYNKNKKKPQNYTPSSSQYVHWECSECGHQWRARISHRSSGAKSGCPECNKSKGERKIKEHLINNNWIKIIQEEFDSLLDRYNNKYFIPQKEFLNLLGVGGKNLSYDFYIPRLNLLIEFQGMQHEKFVKGMHKSKKDFEKQLEHDRRKREYAEKNNIKLLEIWYYNFDKIEEILQKELSDKEVVTIA